MKIIIIIIVIIIIIRAMFDHLSDGSLRAEESLTVAKCQSL